MAQKCVFYVRFRGQGEEETSPTVVGEGRNHPDALVKLFAKAKGEGGLLASKQGVDDVFVPVEAIDMLVLKVIL